MLPFKNRGSRILCFGSTLSLMLPACASATRPTRPAEVPILSTTTTSATVPLQPETQIDALTDGQIVMIASDFHRAEINDATVAIEQAENVRVKAYALEMTNVDSNVEQHLDAVTQDQNIAPVDSTLGASLRASNRAFKETLLGKSGEAFDEAYVTAQLKSHEDALRLFDETLIPGARNPDLKAALQATRARLIQHILVAKQTLAALPAN